MPEQEQPAGLFQESEALSSSRHKQIAMKDLPLNSSIAFYFDNTADKTSTEYGAFVVCQGLQIDLGAANINELLKGAVPASFIPNTLLSNKLKDRSMTTNECYRIEKTWDKGQKFKDGTKAKGYGYTVYPQLVGPQVKAQLAEAYEGNLSGALNISEASPEGAETPAALKKPAI